MAVPEAPQPLPAAPAAGGGEAPRGVARWYVAVASLGLAAGAGMVAFGFRAQSFVDRKFDPYFFGAMGQSLARGEGFLPYGNLIKRRAPLYPLTIGGLYSAFGEHALLVQLLQVALLAATCLLVLDLGRRLFNLRTGVLAGVACALHPMLLRYVADLQLETQLTFLFTLTLWALVRFHQRPTLGAAVGAGVAAGLASLTKAVVVLYPPLFAAAYALLAIRRRRRGEAADPRWGALVAMGLAMAAVISPWTVRNWRATGHLVPISSGLSDAFLRGYVFSKPDYALLRRPPYEHAENECNAMFRGIFAARGLTWEQDDYQTEEVLKEVSRQKLRAEPAAFLRKFAVGLATFWYQMTSLKNSLVAGALAVAAWILALVGWRRARAQGRPAWLLLLPVLYLNLFLAALLALGRYSVPVLPPLLVLAAYGVDGLLARRAPRAA